MPYARADGFIGADDEPPTTDAPPPQEPEVGLVAELMLLKSEYDGYDCNSAFDVCIARAQAYDREAAALKKQNDLLASTLQASAYNVKDHMAAEQEADALRARLETAEAALLNEDDIKRIVRLERLGQILRQRSDLKMDRDMFIELILAVYADTKILREKFVPIAELALKPEEPAPGGDDGGATARHCPVSVSECYYDCPIGTCRQVEREAARGEEEGGTT